MLSQSVWSSFGRGNPRAYRKRGISWGLRSTTKIYSQSGFRLSDYSVFLLCTRFLKRLEQKRPLRIRSNERAEPLKPAIRQTQERYEGNAGAKKVGSCKAWQSIYTTCQALYAPSMMMIRWGRDFFVFLVFSPWLLWVVHSSNLHSVIIEWTHLGIAGDNKYLHLYTKRIKVHNN